MMTPRFHYQFPVIDEMRPYVDAIVEDMSHIFGIGESEALEIINDHWRSFSIDSDNLLGHEEPDYWARLIYIQR
jgi:hypothetical protein